MDKIIRKHYLKSFYIITMIFSFFLLLLHFLLPVVGNYSISFTQWSPLLSLIFIALILKDKSIFNDIKNHALLNKNNLKWILPTIMIPSTLIFISSFIMSVFKINFVVWEGNLKFYLLSSLAILIGCITEEIGWRGFLLPNLQKKYSPFLSSVIVGLLWGLWHFNFTGGALGFVLYIIQSIVFAIPCLLIIMDFKKNKRTDDMNLNQFFFIQIIFLFLLMYL